MTPPDTTPPALVSSTVTNNQTKVSVLQQVTFTFDEELDPATIDNSLVKLTSFARHECYYNGDCFSDRMTGTASYDAGSKSITISFNRPLEYGTVYSLEMPGTVKDMAGNAFGGTTIQFTTAWNAQKKRVSMNTSTNLPYSYYTWTLDAEGRPLKQLYFNAPGPDNTWFTADDVCAQVYQYIYENGQLTQERYLAAGPDTRYNTGDDTISSMSVFTYDHNRLVGRTYFTAGGTDGVPGSTDATKAADDGWGLDHQWGTADDQPNNYYVYDWGAGVATGETIFNARGPDNAWHTADDRASTYYTFEYDTNGNRTRISTHSVGSDQLPMTSDDTLGSYRDVTYDSLGAHTSATRMNYGPDSMYGTADDVPGYLEKYTNDAKGNQTAVVYYYGAGADMTWNTADDYVDYAYSTDRNADGLISSMYYPSPGTDGMYGTADDVKSYRDDFTFGAGGARTSRRYYSGAGPDAQWLTADDIYSDNYEFNAD